MNFQKFLESMGYETRSYSGRNMFGNKCLAIYVDNVGDLFANIIRNAPNSIPQRVDIINVVRNYHTDNIGMSTVVYFPNTHYIPADAVCSHEYLPDEDGTVYICGSSDDLNFIDDRFLCDNHK